MPGTGLDPHGLVHRVFTWFMTRLASLFCRIETEGLERVPDSGPLIVVVNHVNFMDVPALYTRLLPRPITGFAKSESWKNPIKRVILYIWGAFPIRRGEADLKALRWARQVLEDDFIFVMAPEGTRSGHGRLQEAHAGAAFVALQSGAPLLPVVYYGHEVLWDNFPWRRTDLRLVAGHPFTLDAGGERVTSQIREQMRDEMMYQLAALLPPQNRGVYADLDSATETYLKFPPGSQSNLLYAKD